MSSLNRKDFLVLTISSAAIATFLEACSDDPVTPGPTGGTGGTGTAGSGTAGTGTAGTGTAGTGTAGTGTAGTGTAGTGTAGTGTAGGSGGASGGSGGASGGSGGASGGSGGASAGSGGKGGSGGASGGSGGASGGSGGSGGGGGGGMCGTASIMQTSMEMHDHIPADETQLKAGLKMLINGNMSTMAFTLPMDGGHVHTITLTAAQVTMLKGGGMVTGIVSTSVMNHTHTYTIGCGA